MKNKVEDVRNHLVQVMESLNDGEATPVEVTLSIEKAKAMSGLATAYINSVKVEIDAIRLADEVGMLPNSMAEPQKCDRNRGALGFGKSSDLRG
jgi:hypothetical protein